MGQCGRVGAGERQPAGGPGPVSSSDATVEQGSGRPWTCPPVRPLLDTQARAKHDDTLHY